MVGYSFDGQQHRAIIDAINSAKLLRLVTNKDELNEHRKLVSELNNSSNVLTSSIGEMMGDKLSKLIFV